MSNKTRLDVLLVERGLQESRQKAQAIIMAGQVFCPACAARNGGKIRLPAPKNSENTVRIINSR